MKKTNVQTSPFYVASCGCVGLDIGEDEYVVIIDCTADGNDDRLGLWHKRQYDEDKDYAFSLN